LGTDQPVLVYAFVLVARQDLEDITRGVRNLYQRESLVLSELKSSTLHRSGRGQKRYAHIGAIAADWGTRVHMCIVEKRYQVCVMIVETYLDPLLNDRAPQEFYRPRFRQCFADACYDYLDDVRLAEFVEAVRADNPNQIAAVGERLSTSLRLHSNEFVSEAAHVMETRPDQVFRYSERRTELPENSNLPASQYAAFYPGLELVDADLEYRDETADLVRDEDLQFGKLLDLAFAWSQSGEGETYRRRLPLSRIRSCRAGRSTDELGIQLADLVAGLFGRIASQAVRHRAASASMAQIADAWRHTLAPPDEHYLMLSDAVLPRTLRAIFDADAT
jgi:hypothetical protein